MRLRIVILGSGGYVSTPDRGFPSIIVDLGVGYYMFDVGEYTSRQFFKAKLNPHKLKAIFITHRHGDHVLGLPGLTINLYSAGVTGKGSIRVYAPYWCEKQVRELFLNYGGLRESVILEYNFFKEVSGGKPVYSDDYVEVYAMEMEHSVPSVAYKLITRSSGKVIVYSGDTKPTSRIIDFSSGADILVYEASFSEGEEDLAVSLGHSTVKHAIEVAAKAKVKKLILFHLGLQKFTNKRFNVGRLEVIVPSDLDEIYV